MRICLEVSGGVMGMKGPVREVDTSALSGPQASWWQSRVDSSNFFRLPSQNLSRRGRDLMQYTISVEDDMHQHQVTVDDVTASEALLEMINRLSQTHERS